ncbi:hypothetical protein AGOR_G00194490 [Albula goreensis]|uniref:Uncharacterized protein n=1 Tax=Albula goreensis TaxID=1534307 RepID=A0A8T3CUX4_9TELE|nr:hypothetical protein AGOR_G00194490 [Albula goreensis]
MQLNLHPNGSLTIINIRTRDAGMYSVQISDNGDGHLLEYNVTVLPASTLPNRTTPNAPTASPPEDKGFQWWYGLLIAIGVIIIGGGIIVYVFRHRCGIIACLFQHRPSHEGGRTGHEWEERPGLWEKLCCQVTSQQGINATRYSPAQRIEMSDLGNNRSVC